MDDTERRELMAALPYGRRYARALTGSQEDGDALVADALRAMIADDAPRLPMRLALYGAIGEAAPPDGTELEPDERKIMLLTALEQLRLRDAAAVLDLEEATAAELLARAQGRLKRAAAADVLIIEDEPIIAMDIANLVTECGHRVVGMAATERAAVAMARDAKPGLILADINLGAGGDGISAVSRIMDDIGGLVPVIFVTAYPERLLTGERIESTFVIPKPFEPMALAVATYQAVNGRVRV